MFQAAIFDHDGLMVDSEPIQSEAFAEVIRMYGEEPIIGKSGLVQTAGLRESENWEAIMKTHGFQEAVDVLTAKRTACYTRLLKTRIKMQPGLIGLLGLLRAHGIKMALGSSGQPEHIDLSLQTLALKPYFAALVCGTQVKRSKPAPDIFLEAAAAIMVNPADCIVFEDAELGVIAGKAAGMKVIAVPNRYTEEQDFSAADLVVPSLEEVTWEKLNKLTDTD